MRIASTELFFAGALMFFVEFALHALGGADHRPKWAHIWTPLGFVFLAVGMMRR